MSFALSASSVGRSSLGSRAPRETLGFACFCNAVDAMCVSNPVGRTDGFNLKKKKEESIRLSARPACLPLAAWTRIHRLYSTVLSCAVYGSVTWIIVSFCSVASFFSFFSLCVCRVCVYLSDWRPCTGDRRASHGIRYSRDRRLVLGTGTSGGIRGTPAESSVPLGIWSPSLSNTPLCFVVAKKQKTKRKNTYIIIL